MYGRFRLTAILILAILPREGVLRQQSTDFQIAQPTTLCNPDEIQSRLPTLVPPATLYELSTLPPDLRKAVFMALSPQDKAEIWREQLDLFLVANPKLSPDQQRLVEATLKMISAPGFYSGVRPEGASAAMEALEKEAVRLFPDPVDRAVFYRLGSLTPAAGRDTTGSSAELTGFQGLCDCYSSYWDCGGGDQYCKKPSNCDPYPVGCGYAGGHECDGTCQAKVR
jgi:hypothetical protein